MSQIRRKDRPGWRRARALRAARRSHGTLLAERTAGEPTTPQFDVISRSLALTPTRAIAALLTRGTILTCGAGTIRAAVASFAVSLWLASSAAGQEQNWVSQGPAPITSITPTGNQTGAIEAVLTDPNNANVLYVGSTNGGVWKTTNGGASWMPLTDNQASLSIGALAYDTTNQNRIIAGVGRYSAGGFAGGPLIGLTSINATTGTIQQFGTGLNNTNIGALIVAGNTILAGSGAPSVCGSGGTCGLYRTINGRDFSKVTTGLPQDSGAAITDLKLVG